jgi:ABC-type Fe3+ transport system permease subunit/DNA-binding beta-propeller fold protein YncE
VNWPLLQNSLVFAAAATAIACLLGFTGAVFAAGLHPRLRNWFIGVAVVTLALPPFLVVNCWLHLFGVNGAWHLFLPLNIYSLQGAALLMGIMMWPIPMLAVWSAWQRLEGPQLEADLAVRGWSLIRGLLFPLARPAFFQGALLTFVMALNNFAVPTILQVKVFSSEVWIRFSSNFDPLGALLIAWPLIAVPLLLLLWIARREFPWPRLTGTLPWRLLREQFGRGIYWPAVVVSVGLACVSVGLPLFENLLFTRTWTELPGALAAGTPALLNSFLFSLSAAAIVTGGAVMTLSFFLSFGCRRPMGPVATALGWLFWMPFLVPGVFLGIALILVLNHGWLRALYVSPAVVLLAFSIRYLGLGWNPVLHAFSASDPELSDAARVEGASRWQMLRHVFWPQVAPQAGVACYVIFLLTLWDVESIILIYPPGGETLSLRIFNLLHYGHNPEVNALCFLLVLVAVVPLLFIWLVSRPGRSTLGGAACRAFPLMILCFLFCGCAPETADQSTLESRLFASVQVIGSRGAGLGQFLKPRSVAVDGADNFYVADMTGRVQRFASNGAFCSSWQMPQTDIGKPKGMCRDRDGNIVVIEPHYQRINHFTASGELLSQWGRAGTNAGQFTLPRAVAFNSRREAFVSEYGPLDRVQRFSVDRQSCIGSIGRAGTGPAEFNRPEGLCVDARDQLYVADSCNHRVQVFSNEGKLLRVYGKPGRGKGELSYPYDVCVDAAGRQYVCEFGNSRIQVFDTAGRPVEIIGGPGAAPGRFSNPWGIALDSAGNLYVADSQNHRVQKLVRRQNGTSTGRGFGQ